MKVNSENAKRQKICFGNTFGWRPLWSNSHGSGGWRGKMVVLDSYNYGLGMSGHIHNDI